MELWHELKTPLFPINSIQKLLALVATLSNSTLLFGGALEASEGVEEELRGQSSRKKPRQCWRR